MIKRKTTGTDVKLTDGPVNTKLAALGRDCVETPSPAVRLCRRKFRASASYLPGQGLAAPMTRPLFPPVLSLHGPCPRTKSAAPRAHRYFDTAPFKKGSKTLLRKARGIGGKPKVAGKLAGEGAALR